MSKDGFIKFDSMHLDQELHGNEFAHELAMLTMKWGQLEYWLYTILRCIDKKRTLEWLDLFFTTNSLNRKIKLVRNEIDAAISQSEPKLRATIGHLLDEFATMKEQRNLIAHGLWVKGTSRKGFDVQPLRRDKRTLSFETHIRVDLAYLGALNERVEALLQGFAATGIGLLSHVYMKGRRARSPKMDL